MDEYPEWHSPIWKSVSKLDGAVILLEGATSLKLGDFSWKKLAETHSGNAKPTKVFNFKARSSPLITTRCYESIGGGYSVCEYDLDATSKFQPRFECMYAHIRDTDLH